VCSSDLKLAALSELKFVRYVAPQLANR